MLCSATCGKKLFVHEMIEKVFVQLLREKNLQKCLARFARLSVYSAAAGLTYLEGYP